MMLRLWIKFEIMFIFSSKNIVMGKYVRGFYVVVWVVDEEESFI